MRIAILISGRGSNMLCLADEVDRLNGAVEIVLVASNAACDGITQASDRGLPTGIYERHSYTTKADQEDALASNIEESGADWVFLAGYMAILSAEFVARFANKIINIHPSLLPAFKGLNTHERALAAKVTQHGVSIHLVTAALDDGPILAQAALDVAPTETPNHLAQRVLQLEHALYPFVLRAIVAQSLTFDGGSPQWVEGPSFLETMSTDMRKRLSKTIVFPT